MYNNYTNQKYEIAVDFDFYFKICWINNNSYTFQKEIIFILTINNIWKKNLNIRKKKKKEIIQILFYKRAFILFY